MKNSPDLADDTFAGNSLCDDGQHKSDHSSSAVELLGERSEPLRNLLHLWKRAFHGDGGDTTGRRGVVRTTDGEGARGHGLGGACKDRSSGDECGVHFRELGMCEGL